MKSELKAKFIQHLVSKRENEGFTLIELLVVIIIIGILSAIALPSFLNQANKAKQSEAKTYVGSMNRGQQAYYTEWSTFGTDIGSLGIGIEDSTTNYVYSVVGADDSNVTSSGASQKTALRTYGGSVYLEQVGSQSELTTISFLCEEINPGVSAGFADIGTGTDCPAGSRRIQ